MLTKKFLSGLCACVLAALISSVLSAQDYRARVQGAVLDPSSAVVTGATVTLTNVETGVKDTRKTDNSGHYLFDLCNPENTQ